MPNRKGMSTIAATRLRIYLLFSKATAITSITLSALASAVSFEKVNKYAVLSPLLYSCLFYLAFSGLLTLIFYYIEKKLSYYSV